MIPKLVHFCYFYPPPNFPLYGFLAIKSALKYLRPDAVRLYVAGEAHMPNNEWWSRLVSLIDVVRITVPTEIFEQQLVHVAHRADVFRLEILRKLGGIYLDLDTICCRPFDELLDNECVLAHQTKDRSFGLCNAVILAEKGAAFLERWLESYRTFRSQGFDDYWDEHSVQMPLRLAAALGTRRSRELTILPNSAFYTPSWEPWELKKLFEQHHTYNETFCHHLWAAQSYDRYLSRLDPMIIKRVPTTYNVLARMLLP